MPAQSPRLSPLVSLVFAAGICCGCASDGLKNTLGDSSASNSPQAADSSKSQPHSKTSAEKYAGAVESADESWTNDVGRQARADRKVEKDNDPLRNLFVSPKAQEIERSLGVN